MAVGYPEKMRDANGKVATYRETPSTNLPEPPKHPHPDAFLTVNGSYTAGRGIHPCDHKPIAEWRARYIEAMGHAPEDDEAGHPVSGDATTRLARQQCWDDLITRDPRPTYTGTDPCGNPACPHPQPHAAMSLIHHSPWEEGRDPRWGTAYFRDIAHVLYPGGVLPVPVRDEPEAEPTPETDPRQLTIFDALEAMTE